jgi:hypothetical protein
VKTHESLKARWVAWVWRHTPDCTEMSRLASRGLDGPLPLGTRIRMRLHYFICVWCKRYLHQLRFLHAAAPLYGGHAGIPADRGLSAEARRRIAQRLQRG